MTNYVPPCPTTLPKNFSRPFTRTFPNNHHLDHRHHHQALRHQPHLLSLQMLHRPRLLHHHTTVLHLHQPFHIRHNHHRVMLPPIHTLVHHAPHCFAPVTPNQSTRVHVAAEDALGQDPLDLDVDVVAPLPARELDHDPEPDTQGQSLRPDLHVPLPFPSNATHNLSHLHLHHGKLQLIPPILIALHLPRPSTRDLGNRAGTGLIRSHHGTTINSPMTVGANGKPRMLLPNPLLRRHLPHPSMTTTGQKTYPSLP